MASENRPSPPRPGDLQARVGSCRLLAPHVLSIQLHVLTDSAFQYCAGQYIRVHMADGRRRDLSIANACADDNRVEVWVRDVGGDFSRYLFDQLEAGERWAFEGPLGDAWVRTDDDPLVLVAGSTGLGPAYAIVEAELQRAPDRRLELIHGAHTTTDLLADATLRQWALAHPAFTYVPVLDAAGEDWAGEHGRPDHVIRHHARLDNWSAHLFGPPPMVDAMVPLLRQRGVAAGRIHADAFTPGASDLDLEAASSP